MEVMHVAEQSREQMQMDTREGAIKQTNKHSSRTSNSITKITKHQKNKEKRLKG
jgi:hypothetical protein